MSDVQCEGISGSQKMQDAELRVEFQSEGQSGGDGRRCWRHQLCSLSITSQSLTHRSCCLLPCHCPQIVDKDGSLAAANPRPSGKRTAADMLAGAPYIPTGSLAAASSPNGGGGGVSAVQSRRTPRPDVPVSVATRTGNVTSHSNITAEDDGNIDSCIICGDMGMLLCCDVCPLSYHADCAGLSKIPQGFWSCPQCVAKNLGAAAAATASAGGAARGGMGGSAGGAGAAGGVSGSRGGMGGAPSTVALGIGLGLQSGLDPFHQKLNACLDYTAAQCFELDGVTFQCFPPPNMALMDPAKAAAARAERERAAKAAAAAAAAQARAAAAAAAVAQTTAAPASSAAPAAPAAAAPAPAPAVDPTPTA